jgi:XRE family transcriptional regulator, regulator of sulfur utilization
MDTLIAGYLAKNVSQLRNTKGLTQTGLAMSAGIPRSTVTNMESGSANPSLSNLVSIAKALRVSVEELLAKPRRSIEHIEAKEIPVQERGKAKIFKLLPDKIKGMAIDRMELARGAHMPGHPHLRGTKEYLTAVEGEITLLCEAGEFVVKPGDVLAFEGDQPHAYRNSGNRTAVAISIVIPLG